MDGPPNEVMDRYQQASPSALLPLGVRQVLVNGVYDPIVPLAFIEEYEAAARASGDAVEMVNLPDSGHFEMVIPETAVFPTVAASILGLLG
jgi:pimeloyl-ACP methyl ester carboxylesterase